MKLKLPPSQRGNRPEKAAAYGANDIRYCAMHEAGHAVVASILNLGLDCVDIKRRTMPGGWTSMGYTRTPPVSPHEAIGAGEDFALPLLAGLMAGPLAEMEVNPNMIASGAHNSDKEAASKLALFAVCSGSKDGDGNYVITSDEQVRQRPRFEALLQKGIDLAGSLVELHMPAIIATANALIAKTTLTGDEVAEIVRSQSQIEPSAN